jgi:hypothetical protein
MRVPSFGSRMVCTKCGTVGADVRPNWRERERKACCGGVNELPTGAGGRHGLFPRFPIYNFSVARELLMGRLQGAQFRYGPLEETALFHGGGLRTEIAFSEPDR